MKSSWPDLNCRTYSDIYALKNIQVILHDVVTEIYSYTFRKDLGPFGGFKFEIK